VQERSPKAIFLFGVGYAIAALIFLTAPFWVAVGYLAVLAWSAFLLHLIFNQPDPVSEAVAETREGKKTRMP